jgi:hypothetical protein
MNTRRQFLITAPMAVLVTATACRQQAPSAGSQSTSTTAGAPPTFGTGAGAGPPVTPETFAEAEKLMQVTMTAPERQQAADSSALHSRSIWNGGPDHERFQLPRMICQRRFGIRCCRESPHSRRAINSSAQKTMGRRSRHLTKKLRLRP